MRRYERSAAWLLAVLVLVILAQNVCVAGRTSGDGNSKAYAHAPTTDENNSSVVTSYFRHDPFGPNTYAFGYEINDTLRSGNVQFREERGYMNGRVEGAYGYVRPDGQVTITRFSADKQRGYRSDTETYGAGEQHSWQQYWPSQRHGPFIERAEGGTPTTPNATYNKELHLNMIDGRLPAPTADGMRAQHAIDVAPSVDLRPGLLDPIVSDIINGKIPLQREEGDEGGPAKLGFAAVHNFIPPQFPIVPFELPQKLQTELEEEKKTMEKKEKTSEKHDVVDGETKANSTKKATTMNDRQPVTMATMSRPHKYDMVKRNNAEKTLPNAADHDKALGELPSP